MPYDIQSLAGSLTSYAGRKKTDAYLVELGSDDRPSVKNGKPITLAFQYFPDTVSDTKAINYQQKEIPGGSLPLYQWINGGERLISFTAFFSSDVDLVTASSPSGKIASLLGQGGNITDRLRSAGEARRNVDIRSAVAWLRRYMLPSYSSDQREANTVGVPLTYSPSKLLLVLPGSGIGIAGGESAFSASWDSVLCVMTQCDVNYEKFFPSGLPRIASVSLAFAQVPQLGGFVSFPRRGPNMDSALINEGEEFFFGYTLDPKAKNGGH